MGTNGLTCDDSTVTQEMKKPFGKMQCWDIEHGRPHHEVIDKIACYAEAPS